MHLKLSDFGTAKVIGRTRAARSNSFTGTAEFMPPELLNERHTTLASDMWALGVCLFQLTCGRLPFKGKTDYQTFQLITANDYDFDPDFPDEVSELIRELFVQNPQLRAQLPPLPEGAGGGEEDGNNNNDNNNGNAEGSDDVGDIYQWVRAHPFFSQVDWERLQDAEPPGIPAFQVPIKAARPVSSSSSNNNNNGNNEAQKSPKSGKKASFSPSLGGGGDKSPEGGSGSKWAACLKPGEKVTRTGLVLRKRSSGGSGSGSGSGGDTKRMLVLAQGSSGQPKLFFADSNHELDGRIKWSANLAVRESSSSSEPGSGGDGKAFEVISGDRTFSLVDLSESGRDWVRIISKCHQRWQKSETLSTSTASSSHSRGSSVASRENNPREKEKASSSVQKQKRPPLKVKSKSAIEIHEKRRTEEKEEKRGQESPPGISPVDLAVEISPRPAEQLRNSEPLRKKSHRKRSKSEKDSERDSGSRRR
jgi:Protein kinase domain